MDLITLKTFDNPYEAYVVKSKLESEDIRCYIFDDNVIGLNPLYNISVGGVKLKVNSFDLEHAERIIQESFNNVLTYDNGDIISCPDCGSDKIYSGFKSMKSSKGIFSTIISFLFLVFPIYFKTVYRCKPCNFEFEMKPKQ